MTPSASQLYEPSAQLSTPPRRSDAHWDKEIAHLRATRLTMSPAAIECVRAVLEAILKEVDVEPTIAGSARQLLGEITQQATDQTMIRRDRPRTQNAAGSDDTYICHSGIECANATVTRLGSGRAVLTA